MATQTQFGVDWIAGEMARRERALAEKLEREAAAADKAANEVAAWAAGLDLNEPGGDDTTEPDWQSLLEA